MDQPFPEPKARSGHLTRLRQTKMARSSHAYVRGSTVRFYEWLKSKHGRSLPVGPAVWICGDCHVGNLGPLANADGAVEVQIRDLDQTVIGNPAHDLVRLALSLASAGRSSDLPGVTTARVLEEMMDGYAAGLAGRAIFDGKKKQPKIVRNLLKRATDRRWRHLAEERIEDVKPSIPLGDRFWALSPDEKRDLTSLFAGEAMHAHMAKLTGREIGAFKLVDAAYWVKGCSSLGRLRYAVLLRQGKGGALSLFDVKEGVTPAAPRAFGIEMPRDNAERVVTGARALSPYLGERMIAGRLQERSVVVRELMPQDLKIETDQLSSAEAMSIARYLSGVVGLAHGKQMKPVDRKAWISELSRNRSKTLDAPSWLWSNVVELIAAHERSYLEHCRRYALEFM